MSVTNVAVQQIPFQSVTGKALDARLWLPEGEIKGIVQLVHGMAEHIDRYTDTALALNRAGFAVVGHTHLGHGPSAELKGYFGAKDGWQHLIDDVHGLRVQTQARFPGKPYVILGHSMGSFVTRCYLMEHSDGLAAVVLSGTGYFAPAVVSFGLGLAGLQHALGMGKKPGKLLNAISSAGYNKLYSDVQTPFDWLCRDRQVVAAYIADPCCGFPFTVDGYRDMFSGLARLNRLEGLRKMRRELPVLFFAGDKDPVGSAGEGVRKVSEQFRAIGMEDVTVHLYPDGRHEMLNELNRELVWADLTDWLNSRIRQD